MVRCQNSLPALPRFSPNQATTEDSVHSEQILCCYINSTSQIQIIRSNNIPDWYFERVVFPGQRLLFEALSSAQIEIYTSMLATAILSDTISCMRLRVLPESPDYARLG